MNGDISILLAEDSETDIELLRRAFKDAGLTNPLHVARDGQAAIEFLEHVRSAPDDRLPGLVLIDLKMPRRDGLDVLRWIRQQEVLRCIPVIVFSSSAQRTEIERAYALGANAFLVKPPSIVQRADVARFLKDWLRLSQPPLVVREGLEAAKAVHRQHPLG